MSRYERSVTNRRLMIWRLKGRSIVICQRVDVASPRRALLVIPAILTFASCADERESLPIGTAAVDGNVIAIGGACHDDRRLDATETDDRVELTFSVADASGGDCFDCVVIELDQAVGERKVIDTTTDEPIPLGLDAALEDCFETR